jgi:signal transduction histidine kinase
MKQMSPEEPARRTMEKALQSADQVLLEGRERVRDLRAEGTTGNELAQMLACYGHELSQAGDATLKVTAVGSPSSLHPVVRDEIYRIGREALTNAFRHAEASNIEVEITYSSANVRVQVRDNGGGIHPEILDGGRHGHWDCRVCGSGRETLEHTCASGVM